MNSPEKIVFDPNRSPSGRERIPIVKPDEGNEERALRIMEKFREKMNPDNLVKRVTESGIEIFNPMATSILARVIETRNEGMIREAIYTTSSTVIDALNQLRVRGFVRPEHLASQQAAIMTGIVSELATANALRGIINKHEYIGGWYATDEEDMKNGTDLFAHSSMTGKSLAIQIKCGQITENTLLNRFLTSNSLVRLNHTVTPWKMVEILKNHGYQGDFDGIEYDDPPTAIARVYSHIFKNGVGEKSLRRCAENARKYEGSTPVAYFLPIALIDKARLTIDERYTKGFEQRVMHLLGHNERLN